MKTAVYVRVSSDSQDHEAQSREIRRWLRGNGIADARWFEDTISGRVRDRPGLDDLQSAVFNGEVETVVVWKLDRLSRKGIRDGMELLGTWLDRGIRVVVTTMQLDLSGPIGEMVAAIMFGFAAVEYVHIRERQAAGIAAAKERGVYRGRQKGTTKATPDRALELRGRGLTDREIATALGISRRTVQRYLASIDHCGNWTGGRR